MLQRLRERSFLGNERMNPVGLNMFLQDHFKKASGLESEYGSL